MSWGSTGWIGPVVRQDNTVPKVPAGGNHSGRRRLTTTIKNALREVRLSLTLVNHQVGTRAELRDGDLDCLDLIARHGPLRPSEAAGRAGRHPATMTGVLDRLERHGWILRDPHPTDHRAVLVRASPERARDLIPLYAGMNAAIDDICRRYTPAELTVIADFLARVAAAPGSAGQIRP